MAFFTFGLIIVHEKFTFLLAKNETSNDGTKNVAK